MKTFTNFPNRKHRMRKEVPRTQAKNGQLRIHKSDIQHDIRKKDTSRFQTVQKYANKDKFKQR